MKLITQKKAVIFGIGKYGAFWHEFLKSEIEIIGFLDNDPQKQGKCFRGLQVYSITEFIQSFSNDVTILLSFFSKKTADVIFEQFKKEYSSIDETRILWLTPFLSEIDDENFLRIFYKICFGKELDLQNPKTLNEKYQWMKLYDRNPIYPRLTDKYEVRKYVAEKIGEEYLIPCYGCWDNFSDINFSSLPEQFVLKCTHDSGSAIFCMNNKDSLFFDKYWNNISKNDVENILIEALKQNYYMLAREWIYKDIQPRIIAEKLCGEKIDDYKFSVFNGKVKFLHVRTYDDLVTYFTPEWKVMPFKWQNTIFDETIQKPDTLEKMIRLAEIIAKDLNHIRVDFFSIDNKVYFCETCLFLCSGFVPIKPLEYDELFGSWLELPKRS